MRPVPAFERHLTFSHSYVASTRAKLEQLRAQGVRVVGDENKIAISEDVDITDWRSGEIHAGTTLIGRIKVENGVRMFGNFVENKSKDPEETIMIHKNVKLQRGSLVVYDPEEKESWKLSDYMHKVSSQLTEIGEDSVVEGIVFNMRIGANTKVLANLDARGKRFVPFLAHGEIGAHNTILGPVKIVLANLGNGHLIGNFETVKDTITGEERYVTTGPLEITDYSENREYLATPLGQAGRGRDFYVEYIEGFYLKLATLNPDGSWKLWEEAPARFTQGRFSAAMEFSGMLDPVVEEITEITGKEKSGHGILAFLPFGVIGAGAKVIGAPDHWNRENLHGIPDVIKRYDRTYMGVFSVVPPHCEAWGRIGAFSRRRGLSILDEDIAWVLYNAPGVIIDQFMDLPEEARKRLDGFVEESIFTEKKLLEEQEKNLKEKLERLKNLPPFSENQKKLQKTEARLNQLEEGIRRLQAQLDSGVWKIENGEFTAEWERKADGTYICKSEKWLGVDVGETQHPLEEFLKEKQGKEYPVRTLDSVFNSEQWNKMMARIQTGSIIVEEGAEVHPSAILLPGTIIRNGARVEEGAVLYGVDVPSGVVVHKNANLKMCTITGPRTIGEGAKLSMVRINEDIAAAVTATMTWIESPVGKGTTLHAFSGVEGKGAIGKKCTVGGVVSNSTWSNNIRNEHLWTFIEHENIPPLVIEVVDRFGAVHKAELHPPITHGAGTVIQGTALSPVTATAAFFAGMGVIGAGSTITLGFTKKGLGQNEVVGPYTMSRGSGAELKSIGELLEMPSFNFRHVLSYTFKPTPKEDRWAVGYMIEKLVVREIEEMLPAIGAGALADELNKLVVLMNEDFMDISTAPSKNRAGINFQIDVIQQVIAAQQRVVGITAERKRQLDGLKRLVAALDGRYRCRYDEKADKLVFTEGKWKYYKEDIETVDGRYIDAGTYEWMPFSGSIDGYNLLFEIEKSRSHVPFDQSLYQKFTDFFPRESEFEELIEELRDGTYYAPVSFYYLELAFAMLHRLFGNLNGRSLLDFGAGRDARVSLFAINFYGMNVTAVEKDPQISNDAQVKIETAIKQGFCTSTNPRFLPATDALTIPWRNFDIIFYYYTQPKNRQEAKVFRQQLQRKAYEMKPGAVLAILFTNAQVDLRWDEFPMLESLFRPTVRIDERYNRTGADFQIYRPRRDLPSPIIPESDQKVFVYASRNI